MKKASIAALLLLLLTGCWDQLPLRDLHMIDVVGLDLDEERGDVVIDFVVTVLKKVGQGEGEPISETTALKGPSLVEAVGQGEFIDQGPFIGVNTRLYLLSERFASHDPARKLSFLLRGPLTSINTPVVVFEGSVSELLKKTGSKNALTERLNDFITSLETNKIINNVSMMQFILSRKEPLEDFALPLIKESKLGFELSGVLLFRNGTSTKAKLGKEQVGMLNLLLGNSTARQKISGKLFGGGLRRPLTGHSDDVEYGFSVKKGVSKLTVHPNSSGLPKVGIGVQLKINVFDLGDEDPILKPDYVNRMEKELSKHLEEMAAATIEILQKANCDVLGIGKHLKAYHPNIWKPLDWRKDYPRLTIEPKFNVQILNSDT